MTSLESLDITRVIEPTSIIDQETICNDIIKKFSPKIPDIDAFHQTLKEKGSLQNYLKDKQNQISIIQSSIQVNILISQEQMKSLFKQQNQVQTYKYFLQNQLREHLIKNQNLYVQITFKTFETLQKCNSDTKKDLTLKILQRIIKTKANLINTFLDTKNIEDVKLKNQQQDNIIHFQILDKSEIFYKKFLDQGTQINIGQKKNKKYPYPAFKFQGKNQNLQEEYQNIVKIYEQQQLQIVINCIKQNSSFNDFKYYNSKFYKDDADRNRKMFSWFIRVVLFLQTLIFWRSIFDQIRSYYTKMTNEL